MNSHTPALTYLAILLLTIPLYSPVANPGLPHTDDWQELFNGRDLTGWTAKITGRDLGEDPLQTFKVVKGVIRVDYRNYDAFNSQFGHLFYETPYSHYALAISYRFFGDQLSSGPAGWAERNSGVMVHAQAPSSMTTRQDFPTSIEIQFLGGLSNGKPRPTANVCTPGTHIYYNNKLTRQHCLPSSSPTIDGDGWVDVVVVVLGAGSITHYVDGAEVLKYHKPTLDKQANANAQGSHRPSPLSQGYIALQSESHPVEFRSVRLLNLAGCTDRNATNYRDYYVKSQAEACTYPALDAN